MGKWGPNQRSEVYDTRDKAELLLKDSQKAKKAHRDSKACTRQSGGSPDAQCCGCHFWAGAISALTDLLNRQV